MLLLFKRVGETIALWMRKYMTFSVEFWEKPHACSVNEKIHDCFSPEFLEKPHACSVNAREIYAHFSQIIWEKWGSCSYISGLFSWYVTMSLDFTHLLKYVALKTLVTMDCPSSAVCKSTCCNPRSRLGIILLLLLSAIWPRCWRSSPAQFSRQSGLKFLHMNVRSLLPKLDFVNIWIKTADPDAFWNLA